MSVALSGGEIIAGDIFLGTVSRFRPEPQDPAEFLNEDDAYFALAAEDGRAMLIAKENVECVAAPHPGPVHAGSPSDAIGVELALLGGATATGAVVLDTPSGRSRLLDYLNTHRERFLPIHQPERLLLVNRRVIVRVHELI